MKKITNNILILGLLCLFPILAQAQAPDWIKVYSNNGEFSIEIPAKYNFLFDKDGFIVSKERNSYQAKNMYLVNAYTEKTLLSFEIYETDSKVLDILRESDMVEGAKSEIIQNGVKIKQVIKKAPDFYAVNKYFYSKKYIYILTAASRTGENETMKRFFDSVSFKPDTKDLPPNNAILLTSFKPSKIEVITENVKKYTPSNKPKDTSLTAMALVVRPKASYVDAARMYAVQGKQEIRCVFSEDGFMPKIEFINILPQGLARQALFAALRLRFLPQEKDGVPQTVEKIIDYQFTLY